MGIAAAVCGLGPASGVGELLPATQRRSQDGAARIVVNMHNTSNGHVAWRSELARPMQGPEESRMAMRTWRPRRPDPASARRIADDILIAVALSQLQLGTGDAAGMRQNNRLGSTPTGNRETKKQRLCGPTNVALLPEANEACAYTRRLLFETRGFCSRTTSKPVHKSGSSTQNQRYGTREIVCT